jgi:hypothetical protein
VNIKGKRAQHFTWESKETPTIPLKKFRSFLQPKKGEKDGGKKPKESKDERIPTQCGDGPLNLSVAAFLVNSRSRTEILDGKQKLIEVSRYREWQVAISITQSFFPIWNRKFSTPKTERDRGKKKTTSTTTEEQS